MAPTNEHAPQEPVATRLDDLAEFSKGWRAARECGFKSDGATLDALNGSPCALGAFFAAQHTEGAGAQRRKASATVEELNAAATRALNGLGFHEQRFEDVISAALRFSNTEWPAARVLSDIREKARSFNTEVVLKLAGRLQSCWKSKELAAYQATSRELICLLCNVEGQCPEWESSLPRKSLQAQIEHEILNGASTVSVPSSERFSI